MNDVGEMAYHENKMNQEYEKRLEDLMLKLSDFEKNLVNKEFKKLAHDLTLHIAGMDSKDKKSLLKEPFVKDLDITVADLIEEKIAKLGENIKIGKFMRYEL